MEIYPEDLGPRQCRQVLEHRLWCVGSHTAERMAVPAVLHSGRGQVQSKPQPTFDWHYPLGSGIAAAIAAAVFNIPFWVALLFCVIIALLWRERRRWQANAKPPMQRELVEPQTNTFARLIETEIALLQNALVKKGGNDPLLEMYLDMVWAAMNLGPLAANQAETERNAREAIRALGGAIETLPAHSSEGVPDSQTKLQATAARLAAEVAEENDPVVAASLHRRIEALQGQAETVARVKVLLRRNEALREELADQIGALRTSLAAVALGGNDSGPELAGLAARIRRVASEANAITAARVEVDGFLSRRYARADVPLAEDLEQQTLGLNGEAL